MSIEVWSAEDLGERRGEVAVTVLDVRRGERFAQGHIPGARHFSVYGINTYDTDPAPLASFVKTWAFQIALAGIRREDTVVVVGQHTDEPAARAAWFLDWLDHPHVAVLDGGVTAWSAAGGTLTRDAEAPSPVGYDPQPVSRRVATWQHVVAALDDPDTLILDTRSDDEWFGRDPRGTRRAGAIPGAVHQEWLAHLDGLGCLLPAHVLSQRFQALGIRPHHQVIAYCNTGYRSAHAYLALGRAGHSRVRNYVGSWQEWANRDECPVVVPDAGARGAPRR